MATDNLSEPVPSEPVDPHADLSSVLPMTAETRDGHLWVGGVDMVELAREAGTALYVMDEEQIRHQLREFRKWTTFHWKDVETVYAAKAFMCKAICRVVHEEGCMVLCASGGELAIALAAGVPASRVQVHGNNKTPAEIREAVLARVDRIVADSLLELERISAVAVELGVEQPVLLRVTPGIRPDTHGYIQTGQEDSKFGFGLNHGLALAGVKRACELPGIDFAGLHMHIGSQIFALQSYSKAIEVMVEFMAEVQRETSCPVRDLDVGGGIGIKYGLADEPSTIEQFGKVVVDGIKEECERHGLTVPRILIEPGRAVVANAGITLYTVGVVKDIPGIRTYVAVDGGMTDNIRPALYGARYECLVANKADQPRTEVVTIAGKHCETGDLIARDTPVQPPETGDIIAVCATGAYCHSMASNYNKQVRPAVVFVRDGEARVVVRRETYDDLMRCDTE
ncbi:MAG: diaminopimelate decarboxylase [Coriobacteriaceae bacterium]|nr:diaminopimelate decarboxylase [Coriobacteriaceae bacterium]